jgi:hypothetical protein
MKTTSATVEFNLRVKVETGTENRSQEEIKTALLLNAASFLRDNISFVEGVIVECSDSSLVK